MNIFLQFNFSFLKLNVMMVKKINFCKSRFLSNKNISLLTIETVVVFNICLSFDLPQTSHVVFQTVGMSLKLFNDQMSSRENWLSI